MNTIEPFYQVGQENAVALAPIEQLSYFDTRSVTLPQAITPLDAWLISTERPLPLMPLAFRIRDMVCSLFGVAPIGGFSGARPDVVNTGDMLDFFLVEHAADNVLCLTARDRHLDVLTCISTMERTVAITSSVVTHNAFGRLYMLPVGLAHKLIVNALLRRIATKVAQEGPLP